MDPSTRLDDDQIRRILARASDRQAQADRALPAADAGSRSGSAPGLTLAELQAVAGEVGIDAAHVTAAARELELRARAPRDRYPFLGIPKETLDHRVVPGVPDDRAWERIVAEARSEFGVPGVTNSFGSVREWWSSGLSTGTGVQLRLEPTRNGTEVTIRRSNRNLSHTTHALGWTFGGLAAAFGALVGFGAFDPAAIAGPILFGAFSALTFAGGRVLSRLSARKSRSRFARLLDRIDLIARGGGSP